MRRAAAGISERFARAADAGEVLAGVGKRGNLAPAHGLPSPHKYDDAVRV